MRIFPIINLSLLLVALATAKTTTTATTSYNKCDSLWANDIIFEYTGSSCIKQPGCDIICPKSCWQGKIDICSSTSGGNLAVVASALAKANIACGVSPCDPGALNRWLLGGNRYYDHVVIRWSSLSELGLSQKQVALFSEEDIDGALSRGETLVMETFDGKYLLGIGKAGKGRYEVINGDAQSVTISWDDISLAVAISFERSTEFFV
jgi:hypothetical protein